MEIRWSEPAIENIKSIKEYIGKDSPTYADIVAKGIYKKTTILKAFPEIGRIVPEYNKENIREIFFKNYRIIYSVHHDDKIIFILTIIHFAQNILK